MRVLVLGGNGMAGHVIAHYLREHLTKDLYMSIRQPSQAPYVVTLDVTDEKLTYETLKKIQPDVVINAVGILNDDASKRLEEAIIVNSLLPHQLVHWGDELGFKLIHISTDCVFSGSKGHYKETDLKDGTSIYAKTKSLGEVIGPPHLTIRTSIIGPELRKQGIGLFHWFMNQTGTIQGYQKVFWNGVTTLELAKAISWVIRNPISGLMHLTGKQPISKHDLLWLFKDVFAKSDVEIAPNTIKSGDKTLINTRQDATYIVPDYPNMITEMKEWMCKNQDWYTHYLKE